MLILLPPSETKREGGTGEKLDLSSLAFPRLKSKRSAVLSALRTLARDEAAMMTALKLGPTQRDEILHNRALRRSPTLPALDRYTGVLFDALDASTLSHSARSFAAEHAYVHSALFGLIAAGDSIPAYRLSHGSRLPNFSLKKHWAKSISTTLRVVPGLVLDFRSEGYVSLGPLADRPNSYFLRVVSVAEDGTYRALNHFNKTVKGELARALLQSGHDFESIDDLLAWARERGFKLRVSAGVPAELVLTL